MLRQIPWSTFFSTVGVVVLLYYASIVAILYRKQLLAWVRKRLVTILATTILVTLTISRAKAQTADGNNGINEANTLIRSYFTNLSLDSLIDGINGTRAELAKLLERPILSAEDRSQLLSLVLDLKKAFYQIAELCTPK